MRILTRITASSGLDVSSAGIDTITLGNSSVDKILANAPLTASNGINTTVISASTLYVDNPLITFNTAQFETLNVTNSTSLSGTVLISGSLISNNNITASNFVGTASYANTASYAINSLLLNNLSASSYALTSSNTFTGNQVINGFTTISGNLILDPKAVAPTSQEGQIYYDSNERVLIYNSEISNVNTSIGRSLMVRAKNTDTVTLTKGMAVRISSPQGANKTFARALSVNVPLTGAVGNQIIGVVNQDIAVNAFGYATTFGEIDGLNTNAFIEGNEIYVSHTTSGSLTGSRPPAPYEVIPIGTCIYQHINQGKIFIKTRDPLHFGDITGFNPDIANLANGQVIRYQSSDGTWGNSNSGVILTGSFSGSLSATTVSGSTAQFTTITGSNISGSSITGPLVGTLNGVSVINAGTNLSAATVLSVRTLSLTSSITSGLTTISGTTNISSTNGNFTNLTGSALTLSGLRIDDAWTSYNVSWVASVTNPVLGNGTLTGFYKQIGKTVFVRVKLVCGSTTTFGSGDWQFSLPVSASSAAGIQFPCSMLDNGNAWYQGIVNGEYSGFTDRSSIIGQSSGSNSSQGVTAVFPITWGDGDKLQFAGSYEAA